ncbi:MAG: hypothetical protein P4L82_11345 [Ancalomicrobiaceae bacterium]|nr:hypothetical protein [Ancalomicrobiaceae bacterium]
MDADSLTANSIERATVTVEIYSGRENPSWSLTAADKDAVVQRIADLIRAKSTIDARPEHHLGYSGLTVQLTGKTGTIAVFVGGGVVTLGDGGRTLGLRDSGRALESWLAETGAAELRPEVLAQIRGSFGK